MPSWSASDFTSRPTPPPENSTPPPELPPPKRKSVTPASPPPAPPPPPSPPLPPGGTAAPPATAEFDLAPAPVARPPARPPAAPAGKVSTCQNCGYTHTGKILTRCPECSGPMATGASDFIRFSEARWIRQVSLSFYWMFFPIVFHLASAVLRFYLRTGAAIGHILAATLLFLLVFSATRTEKNPHLQRPITATTSRLFALSALLFWILAGAAILYFGGWDGKMPLGQWRWYVKPAIALALLSDAALAVSLGFYGHELAGRLLDDSLRSHTLNAGWLVAFVCIMFCFLHIAEMVVADVLIMFVCSFPIIALGVGLPLFGIFTLVRLAGSLRHAAHDADLVAARRRAASFNVQE